MRKLRLRKRWAFAGVGLCSMLAGGCRGAIFDAVAAGGLDLLHGSVTGLGGELIFGESPSPFVFNSILNAIGSGGGGGGGGGHH